jgi:hypothetical protein
VKATLSVLVIAGALLGPRAACANDGPPKVTIVYAARAITSNRQDLAVTNDSDEFVQSLHLDCGLFSGGVFKGMANVNARDLKPHDTAYMALFMGPDNTGIDSVKCHASQW